MSRLAPTLAALVIVGAFAASPVFGATTRAQYAAQVNPICAEASADAERILRRAGFKTPKKARKTLRRADRLSERTIDSIEAIPPPPADAATAAAWIDSLRQLNRIGDQAGRTTVRVLRLLRRDPPNAGKLKSLARRLNRLRRRANRVEGEGSELATQLGATGCTGPDAPALQP
jgi:predicted transcriptional regulator